tara:strand:- start:5862 stop:6563 length:702 start_codon:yes stop_codon:yes gene_type:complete
MPILSKGTNFAATTQVTSDKLDNLVDAASFTDSSGAAVSASGTTGTCVTGGGLEVTTGGQLQLQDGEIDLVKLSTNNALNSGLYGVLDKVYPIGSIYIATVSTNPDTLLFGGSGLTQWDAYAEGRVIVGKESSGTFSTAGDTGGVETVSLTASQSGLKNHTHSFRVTGDSTPDTGTTGGIMVSGTGSTQSGIVGTPTDSTGKQIGGTTSSSGSAHTNLQPYIVAYIWQRVALP